MKRIRKVKQRSLDRQNRLSLKRSGWPLNLNVFGPPWKASARRLQKMHSDLMRIFRPEREAAKSARRKLDN